ncbi:unnamed protein product, partial [Rotaria magnacalcarata]
PLIKVYSTHISIKKLSSAATSIAKSEYEQICLKWLQACAKALIPSSSPVKQPSSM